MRETTIGTVDGTFALFLTTGGPGQPGRHSAVQVPLTAKEVDDLKALLARATAS